MATSEERYDRRFLLPLPEGAHNHSEPPARAPVSKHVTYPAMRCRAPLRWLLLVALAFLATNPLRVSAAPASGGNDAAAANAERALAKQAIDRKDAEQAVACASRAAALAPGNPECHYVLGIAYSVAARQANVFRRLLLSRKAAACFRRAAALSPGNADIHQRLFEYYEHTPAMIGGGYDKAAVEAAVVKRLDPVRGALDLATMYTDKKQFDLARAQLDGVLLRSPTEVTALYQTGRLAAISGQYLDRGLASLRLCLAMSPSPEEGAPTAAQVNFRIGNILEQKGDKDSARVAYIKALSTSPRFTPAFDALKKLNR
jgi:tetratricopeptide (TPR) repeat protein